MSIFYNLLERKNPLNAEEKAKLYITLKGTGMVRQNQMSKKIAKRLNIFPSLCTSVIECWNEIALEELLNGKSVELGATGYVYLRASSEGAETEEEATLELLKNIRPRFCFSKEAKEALQEAHMISIDNMASGIFKREKEKDGEE